MRKNPKLTIIIPTCNRQHLIANCITSAIDIFGENAQYVVGDSSKKNILSYILPFKNFVKYISLQHLNGNMYEIYNSLLNSVKTEYVLILEDDDVLINKKFHLSALKQLDQYDMLSFAAIDIHDNKYLCDVDTSSIANMIVSWNGEYQFGTTYFKTNLLKLAFKKWFSDYSHAFIYSSDEALAIISMANAHKIHFHNSNIGMKIGINNDNLSWNNLQFSIYSTYSYITDIANIVKLDKDTLIKYRQIQLLELQTMTDKKLTMQNIFLSTYLMRLHYKVKSMIEIKPYCYIKKFIYNMMTSYLNLL